jgi:hypothetical protein
MFKHVDELIRGELSAVQSIDAILGKITDQKEKTELYAIRQDHFVAVDKLSRFAGRDFKEHRLDQTAGPWGAFAKAWTGGASFFGDKAALKALKVGEEYGVKEYTDTVNDTEVDTNLKQIIQSDLLPQLERHIRAIDSYLQ